MKNNEKLSTIDEFRELAKKSLIRTQYSCSGNSNGVDDCENIPIVSSLVKTDCSVIYKLADENDIVEAIKLLKENKLPVNDLTVGKRCFFVALIENQLIGIVAIEIYNHSGLLRSLTVKNEFRQLGVGKGLVQNAELWSVNNSIKELYLLTTTAKLFFEKQGWKTVNRYSVTDTVVTSSEFLSVCPSIANCMYKKL